MRLNDTKLAEKVLDTIEAGEPVARVMGTSTSTLARLLTTFRKAGAVERRAGRYTLTPAGKTAAEAIRSLNRALT
jgi:DNA-binding IclR family transcriptional regulator